MIGNSPNRKPQDKASTKSQGESVTTGISVKNNANGGLNQSHARYEKGMELYKAGKVSINPHGLFKVSGYYECDPEKMTCTCPDHRTRKEACKHLFAAMLFVKNRGKQTIENLEGFNGNSNAEPEPKETPNKPQEPRSKDFDRQATITRLAVLNTATEILKTHGKPIHSKELFEVAAQLEKWALGE